MEKRSKSLQIDGDKHKVRNCKDKHAEGVLRPNRLKQSNLE